MADAGFEIDSVLVSFFFLEPVLSSYQLKFNGRSQLQISINNSRIIQTEHHRIEDSFIYKVQRCDINKDA